MRRNTGKPGNPLDPDITMGMLIDNTHADNVHSFIRGGESQSTLFLDGRKNPWPAAVGPTIFVDVDPASTPQPGRDLRPGAGGDPLQKRRRGAKARQ